MNVCLLNDSFPPIIDGVANVVMNYAGVLTNSLGADVVVATPRYPDANYEGYPYKVVPYPSINTTKIVDGYRTGRSLSIREINEIAEFKPDIVHTHCPAASTLMARVLQHEIDVPVVFTYHTKFDVDIERAVGEGFLKKETIHAMVNNIAACDEIWTVSKGAGENLRALGFEGEYRVMNNGVDFAKGRASEEAVTNALKGYDLPAGIPRFLFVGRLVKYKGIPLILDALAMLKDKGMDFRFVLVGSGPDEEELRTQVRNLKLEDKVVFTGPIRDRERLRAINTGCDLFLFPSTYDTNGIVVREAAACGIASVLIKDSCAAEGVTHGRNGYMIDESPEAMAELLSEICTNMAQVKQVGENAMNEIYISWEDSVKTAYARYEELIDLHKAGELQRKRSHTDFLFEAAADLAEGFLKISDARENIRRTIRESFENEID